MEQRVTIAALQQMKRDRRKIVGAVVYDYQMAQIVDRAGVDLISVGDSVGKILWGHQSDLDVTLDQMLLACAGVRRGVKRALLSCDLPERSVRLGADAAVQAAAALVRDGGADVVKIPVELAVANAAENAPDNAAENAVQNAAHVDALRAIVAAGIPVWAQFGHTLDSPEPKGPAKREGQKREPHPQNVREADAFVAEARRLERAGAAMLDFTYSGPAAGPAVVDAVSIPVLGGLGGGPWLDGRIRTIGNAIGYLASALDDETQRYANVARITLDAMTRYADDVRSGRQIEGEPAARADCTESAPTSTRPSGTP
jgi:3-methyl-2-oxobutanoate hydroxymethyltransferase